MSRSTSLLTHILYTAATNVGILVINLGTGVLVARSLGPSGRGEIAVVATLAQVLGWLAALGLNEGLTYVAAKRPESARQVFGTSLPIALVLGTLGVVLCEALVGPVLDNQSPGLVAVARVFVLSVYISMALSMFLGVLAGHQDFAAVNMLRFVQPALYLVTLLIVLTAGHLTVGWVLAATVVSSSACTALAVGRLLRQPGWGPPSRVLAAEAGRFGLRVQGSLVGQLGNARLDILLMPSVLSAVVIGWYSVAVNTASILYTVVGALGQLLLPAAARRGAAEGGALMVRLLRAALVTGLLSAAGMFVLAPELLRLVYGQDFVSATGALRWLLLGSVASVCSSILEGGLQAAGRPLAASAGQLVGLAVTLVGLLLTLPRFGIVGAAATTTVAYLSACSTAAYLTSRDKSVPLRDVLSGSALRADGRDVLALLRRTRTSGL